MHCEREAEQCGYTLDTVPEQQRQWDAGTLCHLERKSLAAERYPAMLPNEECLTDAFADRWAVPMTCLQQLQSLNVPLVAVRPVGHTIGTSHVYDCGELVAPRTIVSQL